MEALDFETEPLSKVASARLETVDAGMAPKAGSLTNPGSDVRFRI
jgi:hypothetical protein